MLNSEKLDSVERNYTDVNETKMKGLGAEVDVDSKLKLLEESKTKNPGDIDSKSRNLEETEATLSESDISNY